MNLINRLDDDDVIESLWAGTASNFQHDMLQHTITFDVEVNNDEVFSYFNVKFEKVSQLKLTYDRPDEDWDYVELTEIEMGKKENVILFSSELWSSGFLEIEAEVMEVVKNSK